MECRLRLDLETAQQMALASREQLEWSHREGTEAEKSVADQASPHATQVILGSLGTPMATIFAALAKNPEQKDEPAVAYYFKASRRVVERIEAAVQQVVDRVDSVSKKMQRNPMMTSEFPRRQTVTLQWRSTFITIILPPE